MRHSFDQGTPNGIAAPRKRRGQNLGPGRPALGQPGHVRFEPPCAGCALPMLPGEKQCLRCGRPR